MSATPEMGQGKGPSARPVTRSQTSNQQPVSYQLDFPTLQGPAEPQTILQTSPPIKKTLTNAARTMKTKTTTSSPLLKIAKMIDQIISKHNPPGQVKQALTEVAELAKKTVEEEKEANIHVPLNAVKTMHERFKADLLVVHGALDDKISDIQTSQRKLLSSLESLNKSTKNLCSTTKELEGKVTKVNNITDKIATTTSTYRDVLLAKPANQLRSNTDPKVLDDLDRRARQVLVGHSSDEENTTLGTSLLDLKDKANKIVTKLDNPTRPEAAAIESVTRTCTGSILLLLNSKEAADWLREPDVVDKFLDKFAIGASIKGRSFSVMLKWVPIIFNPDSFVHHREIEEANNLPDHSIQKAR